MIHRIRMVTIVLWPANPISQFLTKIQSDNVKNIPRNQHWALRHYSSGATHKADRQVLRCNRTAETHAFYRVLEL